MKNEIKLKLMVVDDEESIRDILSDILMDEGYDVLEAEDGQVAMKLFAEHDVAIVLTDIRMPGMSGLELLEMVKSQSPETEVIIMTSHASFDTALAAMRNGAYDYLVKPFEDIDIIPPVIHRAATTIRLTLENQSLIKKLKENNEELELANESLKELAIKDGLTGLYNIRYFHEMIDIGIANAMRHQDKCALIFTDVDFFKKYNDTYGHPAGDEVLVGLAEVLKSSVRANDLLARYGGEEFIILLPSTDKEGAAYVAEKMRSNVAATAIGPEHAARENPVRISVGVACYPEDASDVAALIKVADNRLYLAKDAGRNQVCIADKL